ncbi:HNH endonuclease [Chishuiella changwenlii]|uniref:HNH endonuclease n=1 Tax=Chishuiella changwenlii TaxID=1434701 RepID=UPI001E62C925|nr:HNH endonuclease [Chishuiella changwenlii]
MKIKEENNLKEQIKFEILEKKRKEELRKEVLQELQEEGFIFNDYFDNNKRESISQETQDRVWNRDGGRCVKCGNNEKLEFDHIIPFSKGGSNTYRNLQLLCEKCNRTKSNKIG